MYHSSGNSNGNHNQSSASTSPRQHQPSSRSAMEIAQQIKMEANGQKSSANLAALKPGMQQQLRSQIQSSRSIDAQLKSSSSVGGNNKLNSTGLAQQVTVKRPLKEGEQPKVNIFNSFAQLVYLRACFLVSLDISIDTLIGIFMSLIVELTDSFLHSGVSYIWSLMPFWFIPKLKKHCESYFKSNIDTVMMIAPLMIFFCTHINGLYSLKTKNLLKVTNNCRKFLPKKNVRDHLWTSFVLSLIKAHIFFLLALKKKDIQTYKISFTVSLIFLNSFKISFLVAGS